MSAKRKFKHWLYSNYPLSKVKVERFFANKPLLRRVLRVGFSPTFSGWGMTTVSNTPWGNGSGLCAMNKAFTQTAALVSELAVKKRINLTQFRNENIRDVLDKLMWRHYLVYWTASYAAPNTRSDVKNLVECGVCDGLTAFFALSAVSESGGEWHAYLYDAWDAMREDLLLEKEKKNVGEYAYLSVENTRANLSSFSGKVCFNKGYIPELFARAENPSDLVWMHIDLNSATPTVAALDFFWNKMVVGGVILLDDYGWPGYEDTRDMIHQWMHGRNGYLLPLPTGQAIIFKQ